jgi:hypothetical protein
MPLFSLKISIYKRQLQKVRQKQAENGTKGIKKENQLKKRIKMMGKALITNAPESKGNQKQTGGFGLYKLHALPLVNTHQKQQFSLITF